MTTTQEQVDSILTRCNFDEHLKKVSAKISNLESRVDSEVGKRLPSSAPSIYNRYPRTTHFSSGQFHSIRYDVIKNHPVGKAYNTASKFYHELINAKNEYRKSGDQLTFLAKCTDALSKAEPELNKHRGWKPVLQGFINLILKLFGKEISLQTDSGKILHNLKESLKKIKSENDADNQKFRPS